MATEIDPKIVKTSQELLPKVVKKPVITEKLLKRPPFRFLHDLMVKTHGFLKDLYADTEMIADNVKEKEAKIAFLQKAIDATGFITGDVVNVKPSKIVAGLEVDRTNEWLQTMAKAVIEKKSSADAVKRVLSGEKPTKRNSTSNTTAANNNKKKALNENTKTSNNKIVKTKRETNDTKETKSEQKKQIIKESKQSKEVKETKDSIEPKEAQQPQQSQQSLQSSQSQPAEDNQTSRSPVVSANSANHRPSQLEPELSGVASALNGNASKPTSASQDSPKIEKRDDDTNDQLNNEGEDRRNGSANNESVHQQKPVLDQAKTVRPKTGAKQTVPPEITQNSAKPVSRSVRPPTRHERPVRSSARPSSSRPAPPRVVAKTNEDSKLVEAELEEKLRLLNAKPVENLITENTSNEDDQDFIVTKAEDIEPSDRPVSSVSYDQKGSLVKQLVDTKKELEGSQSSDVPNDDKKPVRQTNRDIEKLRQTIQSLSQTANPLGKVLDYLQEDIDFMVSELKSWQQEYKRNVQLLEKSRNATQSQLEPFRDELSVLDNDIRQQIDKISATKANIIRNGERLHKMAQMVNRV